MDAKDAWARLEPVLEEVEHAASAPPREALEQALRRLEQLRASLAG